jgi:hypothetical protein
VGQIRPSDLSRGFGSVGTLLSHSNGRLENVSLRFHLPGLATNSSKRAQEENSLPDQRSNLQDSHEGQDACKPFNFPLYAEIIAGLVAQAIGLVGAYLYVRNRFWGVLVIALALAMVFSVLTTVGFCDPLFWRAEWRSLTGKEANRCQCSEQSENRQSLHIPPQQSTNKT